MVQQFTRTIKAKLSPSQVKVFDHWRECYRVAWNAVLNEIEFTERYRQFNPQDKRESFCSPIGWEYKPYYLDDKNAYAKEGKRSENAEKILKTLDIGYNYNGINYAPFTSLINHPSSVRLMKESTRYQIPLAFAENKAEWGWKGGYGYSCPINYHYWDSEGEIDFIKPVFDSLIKDKSISGKFRKKHLKTFRLETQDVLKKILTNTSDGLPGINQKVLDSYMNKLNLSYINYRKGDGGKPKFKSYKNSPLSIFNSNPDGSIVVKDDSVYGFASSVFGEEKRNTIYCPGLSHIWKNHDGTVPQVTVIKIVKTVRGYELQLTGEIQSSIKQVRQTDKLIGFDPGLLYFLTDDQGNRIQNPRFYEKSQQQLAKLERQIANKKTINLFDWLHDKNRLLPDITIFNISKEKAELLIHVQTEKAGVDLIGNTLWQKLKHNIPINLHGKRILELQELRTKLHNKIAKQRKHFLEDKSTMIVRNNQYIAIEKGLQSNENKAVPLPVKDDNGQYISNNKEFITNRTKKLVDTGLGYFLLRLKQKSDYHGRNMVAVEAMDTTNICPCCNYNNDYSQKEKQERILTCKQCGYTEDQDKRAALLIAIKGFDLDHTDLSQFSLSDDLVKVLQKRKECESVVIEKASQQEQAVKQRRARKRKDKSG